MVDDTQKSFFSTVQMALVYLVYAYGWYILAALGVVILFIGYMYFVEASSLTLFDRIMLIAGSGSDFFLNCINAIKNGCTNIWIAVQDWILGLIPSMEDIWNGIKDYVLDLLPDLSNISDFIAAPVTWIMQFIPSIDDLWNGVNGSVIGIKDYVLGVLPDLTELYSYVNGKVSWIFDSIPEMIKGYLVDSVFQPLTSWWGYEWNHDVWIPWNLYYAAQDAVIQIMYNIPGVGWLLDNAESLQDYLSGLIG